MKNTVRTKVITIGLLIMVAISALWVVVFNINKWFSQNELRFNKPVSVELRPPVEVVERKKEIVRIIEAAEQLPELKDLTPIEEYICSEERWGLANCKVALAVFRAESGMRADAWNANTNGSIDVGIAQINSVHFSKEGCGLADLVDPYKNVDCAYKIWEAQGWTPWVAFNNGAFKENL